MKYIEENEKAYYLRTFIKGTSLIQDKFLKNPLLLIVILKDVIERLRKLDQYDCPFVSDTSGNDFVHGDLCLPNIIVDENNQFAGFIDLSNAGKGDKDYDYRYDCDVVKCDENGKPLFDYKENNNSSDEI